MCSRLYSSLVLSSWSRCQLLKFNLKKYELSLLLLFPRKYCILLSGINSYHRLITHWLCSKNITIMHLIFILWLWPDKLVSPCLVAPADEVSENFWHSSFEPALSSFRKAASRGSTWLARSGERQSGRKELTKGLEEHLIGDGRHAFDGISVCVQTRPEDTE